MVSADAMEISEAPTEDFLVCIYWYKPLLQSSYNSLNTITNMHAMQ